MERVCFLFGHGDTPQTIFPSLKKAIEQEVAKGTTLFYVGHHGNFDRFAAAALRSVSQMHQEITVTLLISQHPAERKAEIPLGFDGTFYPPLLGVPRRYALVKANQYMVILISN